MNYAAAIKNGSARSPQSALALIMPEEIRFYGYGRAVAVHSKIKRRVSYSSSFSSRGMATTYNPPRLPKNRPQAITKMIPGGGVRGAKSFRDQLAYLQKDGTVDIHRADDLDDTPISTNEITTIAELWGLSDRLHKCDQTSHFVVSWPTDTNRETAAIMGREWAQRMFGGEHGETHDHLTAFHDDTENPHTHVVVNRTGMEYGHWLKVSKRAEINYDRMREVAVEIAAKNGIVLDHSKRFERGEFSNAEHTFRDMKIRADGREPPLSSENEVDTLAAKGAALIHAQKYHDAARRYRVTQPDLADAYDRASTTITDALDGGRKIERPVSHLNFKAIHQLARNVEDPVERIQMQLDISALQFLELDDEDQIALNDFKPRFPLNENPEEREVHLVANARPGAEPLPIDVAAIRIATPAHIRAAGNLEEHWEAEDREAIKQTAISRGFDEERIAERQLTYDKNIHQATRKTHERTKYNELEL